MTTKADLLTQNTRLSQENTLQMLALADLLNGKVTNFRHKNHKLTIARANGACGGIVIQSHAECGLVGVYYFEAWYSEVLRNAMLSQSEESLSLRDCAEKAAYHIRCCNGSASQVAV